MDFQEVNIVSLISKSEILKTLECPICREIPFPPIYNCERGHTICSICKEKVEVCALCKRPFPPIASRNFLAETLVQNSLHKCKYQSKGCPAALTGDKMMKHVKICKFKTNEEVCKPFCKPARAFGTERNAVFRAARSVPAQGRPVPCASFPVSHRFIGQPPIISHERHVPHIPTFAPLPVNYRPLLNQSPAPAKKILSVESLCTSSVNGWTDSKLLYTVEYSENQELVQRCKTEIVRRNPTVGQQQISLLQI